MKGVPSLPPGAAGLTHRGARPFFHFHVAHLTVVHVLENKIFFLAPTHVKSRGFDSLGS